MQAIRNILTYTYLRHIKGIRLPKELILFALKRYEKLTAIIDGNNEITYGQLYQRSTKLANALLASGIKKGEKLGLLIYNCPEYFEIRIATYLTGIVLVPLSRDLSMEDLIVIANDCGITSLICHPEILSTDLEKLTTATRIKTVIPITEDNEGYGSFLQKGKEGLPTMDISPEDLASINFSSGTTGRPKGIMLTHANWMKSFYNYLLNAQTSMKTNFTFLHIIPLATAGSTAVLPCMAKGARNIITNDFNAKKVVSLIKKYKVARIFLPSSWFINFLIHCKKNHLHFDSLEGIIVGTAPLAGEKLKEGIEHFGPIIEVGYGMAEILPPLFLLNRSQYMKDGKIQNHVLSSVGKQLKGVDVKIVDKDMIECPRNEIGKIALKCPTISQGYFNNPELTAIHYQDDWFCSNDYGYLDEKGYLFIMGRAQDILLETNSSINFSRQPEEILHQHPNVKEACIVDSYQTLTALISLKEATRIVTETELKDFCKNKLPESLIPDKIIFCDELPTKTTGKWDIEGIKRIAVSYKT